MNHIRQIEFNQVKSDPILDYTDDRIVILTDIKGLPIENGSMQADMAIIIICTSGKLQVELNALPYTIHRNDVLVCMPNMMIDNYMLSPDFDGSVFGLSQKGLLGENSENEQWDITFHLAGNPIIHISEESMRMFYLYKSMLMEKLKMERTTYYKEIIISIVKAALYELMANVGKISVSYGNGPIKQREILFKRFIELLTSTRIKPRNVSWYAEQLCVTPKYLSTVSKQVSRKTALVWINEYISVDIRFWLKNTNKTIKEIAVLLNFPNISFFGKYCRARLGASPTELRLQLRKQPDNG